MSWFSDLFKKEEPQTKVIEDPYKTVVSKPLSTYLKAQVGRGLPRYQGGLYEPLDTKAYNRYQDFLSLSPGDWYTKGVQEPTMKAMREEIPLIEEGWAGGLRGSGRFRDVEDYMSDVGETLAEGRYKAELEIPQAQFGMAQGYSQMRTQQLMTEYADWMKSLPEMNPALDKALQFLAGPSGRDVLSYTSTYPIYDLLAAIIKGSGSAAGAIGAGSAGGAKSAVGAESTAAAA